MILGGVDDARDTIAGDGYGGKEHLPAWFDPCRNAVRVTPRYSAPMPSSLTTVYAACAAFLYFGISKGSDME